MTVTHELDHGSRVARMPSISRAARKEHLSESCLPVTGGWTRLLQLFIAHQSHVQSANISGNAVIWNRRVAGCDRCPGVCDRASGLF